MGGYKRQDPAEAGYVKEQEEGMLESMKKLKKPKFLRTRYVKTRKYAGKPQFLSSVYPNEDVLTETAV
ncbi:hypothetical protein NDU88_003454 [Pleurodeles waltl]|uniref:Uncharacterized protein n=1 Tax=Pleurodeles waltl TaxID=8319 RepID=A0AAV7UCV1_PLEWA|nr:hypothetical protein NDU88_003454 [Pleurodeles waltl]